MLTQVYPSKDDLTRVVSIEKMDKTSTKQGITKIILLSIVDEKEKKQMNTNGHCAIASIVHTQEAKILWTKHFSTTKILFRPLIRRKRIWLSSFVTFFRRGRMYKLL